MIEFPDNKKCDYEIEPEEDQFPRTKKEGDEYE